MGSFILSVTLGWQRWLLGLKLPVVPNGEMAESVWLLGRSLIEPGFLSRLMNGGLSTLFLLLSELRAGWWQM